MSRPIPATTETHGPFRKVAEVVARQMEFPPRSGRFFETLHEVLECGHDGRMLRRPYASFTLRPGKRRRCWPCGYAEQQAAKEAKARIFEQSRQLEKWRRTPEGKATNDQAVARRRSFVVVEGDQ